MNPILNYAWLVRTLMNNPHGLTLVELGDRWDARETGRPFHRRNFQQWRNEAEEIFKIKIGCTTDYRYFIEKGLSKDNELESWLLHSLNMTNLVEEFREQRKYVILERMPAGEEFLPLILEAISSRKKMTIVYHRHGNEKPKEPRVISPLCLRLFENQWYMVVEYDTHKGDQTVVALDRIVELNMLEDAFKPPRGFSAQSFFKDSFGVWVDRNLEAKTVVLKMPAKEARYLRNTPLHESQKETVGDGYSLFTLKVRLTEDFYLEMLKHAYHGEILEPQELREEMKRRAEVMLENLKAGQ